MKHQFSRNQLLIGEEGLEKLKESKVLILGIGGVGTFSAETLARSGVGTLILVDKDNIDITNVNRQIHATTETVGESKVEMMADRIRAINPKCKIIKHHMFYTEETYDEILTEDIDYIVDASDTIQYKIHIIEEAIKRDIKIISVMGAANKTDPTRFVVTDIMKTHTDPVARVIRNRLKQSKIKARVPVVFSDESPVVQRPEEVAKIADPSSIVRKAQLPPTSNAFTPSVAGIIAGSWVYEQILKDIEVKHIKDK